MKQILITLAVLLSLCPAVFGQFASDTFTDTNGTLLENHTPDLGTSWTKGSGLDAGIVSINANTIYGSGASADIRMWYIGVTSTNADYDVQATFKISNTSATSLTILGRASTSAVTAYGLRCAGTGWALYKWVAGTRTTLGSYTGDACTTARVGKLEMRGTSISAYVDGVLRIGPVTNSAISAAGRAGLATFYADQYNSRYIDNWSATDAPATVARRRVIVGE